MVNTRSVDHGTFRAALGHRSFEEVVPSTYCKLTVEDITVGYYLEVQNSLNGRRAVVIRDCLAPKTVVWSVRLAVFTMSID